METSDCSESFVNWQLELHQAKIVKETTNKMKRQPTEWEEIQPLVTIVKKEDRPRCLLTDEWMKKYEACIGESTAVKNKTLPVAAIANEGLACLLT